jgi:hypothetical protein
MAGFHKIGVLYGMENTFPPALVDCINNSKQRDIVAEHLRIGAVLMAAPSGYHVIIDRVSHEIDFYRAFLKNAALSGTFVINNPFWWSADDRFFHYALASKLGMAVPKTAILPHKVHPPGTTGQSMRNLQFPLNWEEIFEYVGFPAFLKPLNKSRWKPVYRISSQEEFFDAYDQTGSACMILQAAIPSKEYFRCYVVGQEKVRVIKYDPTRPHHLRYCKDAAYPKTRQWQLKTPRPHHLNNYCRDKRAIPQALHERIVEDCLKLCKALGYDFNMIEFAVWNNVPYAIDFLNPVPDVDLHSIGPSNFNWIVENMAEFAIRKALSKEKPAEMRWQYFLNGPAAARAVAGTK